MDRITGVTPPDIRAANQKNDKKSVESLARNEKTGTVSAEAGQENARSGNTGDRVQINNSNEKIAQIGQFLESLERSTQTIRDSQDTLDKVREALQQAKRAIANGDNQGARKIIDTIDETVARALASKALLISSDNVLTTPILEKPGVAFSISGMDVSVAALGLSRSESLTDLSIGLADEQVTQIKQYLDDGQRKIQNSRNFSENVLQTIDIVAQSEIKTQSEEAANLLALQTRQMLSDMSQSLAGEAQKAVISLFGQA